jgi:hypothetical protein
VPHRRTIDWNRINAASFISHLHSYHYSKFAANPPKENGGVIQDNAAATRNCAH